MSSPVLGFQRRAYVVLVERGYALQTSSHPSSPTVRVLIEWETFIWGGTSRCWPRCGRHRARGRTRWHPSPSATFPAFMTAPGLSPTFTVGGDARRAGNRIIAGPPLDGGQGRPERWRALSGGSKAKLSQWRRIRMPLHAVSSLYPPPSSCSDADVWCHRDDIRTVFI